MELVKYLLNGGVVTIEVQIRGLITWRYVYDAEDRRFVKTSQDAGPFIHTLGFPHELNNDINNWDVQLGNVSNEDQDYSVVISWMQDGNVLHTWESSGSLAVNEVKTEPGSALLAGIGSEDVPA